MLSREVFVDPEEDDDIDVDDELPLFMSIQGP